MKTLVEFLKENVSSETLKQIVVWLKGKKTYILSIILASYEVSKVFGVNVTPEQNLAILGLFGALFATTLSAKIERLGSSKRK